MESQKLQQDAVSLEEVSPGLATLQRSFMRVLLRIVVIVLPFALGWSSYAAWIAGQKWLPLIFGGIYAVILVCYFWRSIPFRLRSWTLLWLLYANATANFLRGGSNGLARMFLLFIPFLARLFLTRRDGIVSAVLCLALDVGMGFLFAMGILSSPEAAGPFDIRQWLPGTFVLFILSVLIVVGVDYFLQNFDVLLSRSRVLADDLKSQRAHLEAQVTERTATIARRARYLEATAKIARGASISMDDPELLYAHLVSLIAEQLGFYNVSLFLVDSAGEWAELRAASSEAGKHLLEQDYRLRVGVQGVVGYAADRGEVRVVADVRADVLFRAQGVLPATRSEVALPLRVAGAIIGVLDVQSVDPHAFSEEDVAVLQSLADEVSVAVSNVRLFQQLQESIQAERRARGESSSDVWREQLLAQSSLGFMKQKNVITPSGDFWEQEMASAVKSGRPALSLGDPRVLAVPIKAGGRVVAVIDARLPDGFGKWQPEQISLLEALSDELGEALERARLYEETQRRATREQLSREVTTRVRESLDIETILLTAVSEIGSRLGVETEVWMGLDLASDEHADT